MDTPRPLLEQTDAGAKRRRTLECGTRAMYVKKRCRCPACVYANRAYFRKYFADQRRRAAVCASATVRHGIRSTYVRGCRCGFCKAANSRYLVAYRARKIKQIPLI